MGQSLSNVRKCTVCNKDKYFFDFIHFNALEGDICTDCREKVPDHIPRSQIVKFLAKKQEVENVG